MARPCGCSIKCKRLRASVPHGHWKTTTIIGALTLRGIIAPWVLCGPIDRLAFEAYVEKVLLPELRPGDIVVMDNLSSHKGPCVREMIEAAGAALLSLPHTARTSTLSSWSFQNSRRCSAKLQNVQSPSCGTQSVALLTS